MEIQPFEIERYFAAHEFSARYLLSSSDCESLSMEELVSMADGETSRMWKNLKLGYTESCGHPLLRSSVSELYEEISSGEVIITVPEEGIFLLMHALLAPGDHVVCTFPGYQSLYEVARSMGCEVSRWEPDEGRGWRFDPETLARLIRPDTALVVINFPHNPTGYVPSLQDFDTIIDITRQHGAYLLSDEMYRYLEIEPHTMLPPACDRYEMAFTLSGLSKSFGLPGLRIGWIATRYRKKLEKIAMLKDYTTICGSAPSEILAIAALRNRNRIIKKQLLRVKENLCLLDSFFRDYHDLFSWHRPKGGSVCFPRMRAVENTCGFCEQLVDETGILLVSSCIFGFGTHHVRIGFGRENFPEAIEELSAYLEKRFEA
ncbi:MAG: aminotransferase class I/II-fold pyridoxal phosphate-dependent enzyme [Spirochaetes bacterium]|nr:aminotransferase class I/II-fold pyridoxal phosphate-dependent enzyme [Spirochaetota bacterium]